MRPARANRPRRSASWGGGERWVEGRSLHRVSGCCRFRTISMVRTEVSEAVEAARPSPSHEPFTVKSLAVDERFGVASSRCDELIRFRLG